MDANLNVTGNVTGKIEVTGALNGVIEIGGGSEPVLEALVLQRGYPEGQTFTPPEGVDGYSSVQLPATVTYAYTSGWKFAVVGIPEGVVDTIDYVMAVGTSGTKYFDKRS